MSDKIIEDDPIKAATEEAELPADDQHQEPEGKQEEIPAELGIEALRQQIEMEKAGRLEAERRANAAQQQAARSDHEVQDSNLQIVVSAIETVRRDNMMNRKAYAEALAGGDFEKAAEINDAMSLNNAKLLQLENGRVALEQRLKSPPRAPAAPRQPEDPVEAIASQLSPKSAAWVRAHPECVRDGKKYTRMISAHNIAIDDGLVADSPEYFEYIEMQMGIRKAPQPRQQDEGQDDDATAAAAKPMQRRPPPPQAVEPRALA